MTLLSRMNSAKYRLVKLFRFLATEQEDSPSVDFLLVAHAAKNLAIDFPVFGEAAAKNPGGWYSL